MLRSLLVAVGASLLLVASGAPAVADTRPGDSCSPEGSKAPFEGAPMSCEGGKWVLDGPPPSQQTSSLKAAGNFRTVGVALDAATFASDGRQVADATAIRLPNGKIRLFAFVNSSTTLPGVKSATSANRKGTTFVSDGGDPLPGMAAGQPRVVSLGGKSMRLFYTSNGNINAAISRDGGETFVDEGPVITTAQAGFEPGGITVIRHKGKWRAYFSNLEKPGERTTRVMRTATSKDMLNWTMGPVITQKKGPLKAGGSHPFAIVDKGRIALYYAGDRPGFYGILVSTSKNGVTFTREKTVMAGGGDPDIVRVGKKKWLMYYGADLGADGFGVKVAVSTKPVVP